MDVDKYRALFVEEAREHLEQLSRLLVELEANPQSKEVADEVFRVAHSIKGMAGVMGYEPITTVAHRMEDVVGAERNLAGDSQGRFARAVIDLLLRGSDALASQIEAIAAGEPLRGSDELVRDLLAAAPAASATMDRGASGSGSEPTKPRCATRSLCVHLAASCSAPSVRAFLVHRKLSAVGDIVASEPSIDEIKAGQLSGSELRFVFAMSVDEAQVQSLLSGIPDIERATFEEGPAEPQAVSVSGTDAPDGARALVGSPAPNDAVEAREAVRSAVAPKTDAAPSRAAVAPSRAEGTRGASTVRVRTDILDTLIDTVGELYIDRERLRILLANGGDPEVTAAFDGLDARIRRIRERVMAIRMLPLRTLTDRYPRLVRDLCHTLDKAIELDVSGEDIELDRAILDSVDVPLIHVLRNAIDHGIEPAAERVARGKKSSGRVAIQATRDCDTVAVTIEDDGRGLDPNVLRRVAVQRGLVAGEHVEALSLRDTYFLICLPGFSSKAGVTEVSGRGVGMDVVRAQIESIGGSIDIESTFGLGTRITLRLPLTLAIVPALLVRAGGRVFAIPVAKVAAVRENPTEALERADGTHYMTFQQRLVPVSRLTDVLHLPPAQNDENVLLIGDGRAVIAVGVERIVGYHEVVVKPLGEPLEWLDLFSGATILGDGQPVLILDLPKAFRAKAAA